MFTTFLLCCFWLTQSQELSILPQRFQKSFFVKISTFNIHIYIYILLMPSLFSCLLITGRVGSIVWFIFRNPGTGIQLRCEISIRVQRLAGDYADTTEEREYLYFVRISKYALMKLINPLSHLSSYILSYLIWKGWVSISNSYHGLRHIETLQAS